MFVLMYLYVYRRKPPVMRAQIGYFGCLHKHYADQIGFIKNIFDELPISKFSCGLW